MAFPHVRHSLVGRFGVAAGVLLLAWTSFLYNSVTPWAYLNAIGGLTLAACAWLVGLRLWWAVLALPLWQILEVSIYYPWGDPGIPISIFLNPVVGLMVVVAVFTSATRTGP
ncbi:hypothetical protein MP11Mi_14230 [Gordonia sp. MP11Mi]|uniref:Uncharacterized protein n=1 Tax=Gordonia sp. MP11Mi TaxID=3022769 RepID=A0AA97GTR8_9ACTN